MCSGVCRVPLCLLHTQHRCTDHCHAARLVPGAEESEIRAPYHPHSLGGNQRCAFVRSIFVLLSIKIEFTRYKIHPFKVYTSVLFNIAIKLCKPQHHLIPGILSPQRNPISVSSHSPVPPTPQPLETSCLLPSEDMPVWTFHVSGVIHEAFCVWLFSLSTAFSKFIQAGSSRIGTAFRIVTK